MKTVIVIFSAALILCGCRKPAQSAHEKLAVEANELLLQECTNETIGLTRIISAEIYKLPNENPTNWVADEVISNGAGASFAQSGEASATVEYVNSVGGIERTNIPFVFKWMKIGDKEFAQTNLTCMPDFDKIYAERMRKYHEELNNIGK
jgi:hypothetical protein